MEGEGGFVGGCSAVSVKRSSEGGATWKNQMTKLYDHAYTCLTMKWINKQVWSVGTRERITDTNGLSQKKGYHKNQWKKKEWEERRRRSSLP